MYYLIKYGYDGTKFTGFQRGNGNNSVEDSIINVLLRYEIGNNMESAARTDRYVSARGNVFLVDTNKNIKDVMGILNAKIPDMFFYSYSTLNEYYNPRYNSMKKYSYIITKNIGMAPVMETLREFVGRHDFANFCKLDSRNTIRTITAIDYSKHGEFYVINFYGKSFIWHQIRSIIAFALMGNKHPFSIEKKFTYLAKPEPLVLMDIIYENMGFEEFDFRRHKRCVEEIKTSVKLQYVIYDVLANDPDKYL
jgi:tRNA pseudouridine38-40 synthase